MILPGTARSCWGSAVSRRAKPASDDPSWYSPELLGERCLRRAKPASDSRSWNGLLGKRVRGQSPFPVIAEEGRREDEVLPGIGGGLCPPETPPRRAPPGRYSNPDPGGLVGGAKPLPRLVIAEEGRREDEVLPGSEAGSARRRPRHDEHLRAATQIRIRGGLVGGAKPLPRLVIAEEGRREDEVLPGIGGGLCPPKTPPRRAPPGRYSDPDPGRARGRGGAPSTSPSSPRRVAGRTKSSPASEAGSARRRPRNDEQLRAATQVRIWGGLVGGAKPLPRLRRPFHVRVAPSTFLYAASRRSSSPKRVCMRKADSVLAPPTWRDRASANSAALWKRWFGSTASARPSTSRAGTAANRCGRGAPPSDRRRP